MLCQLDRAAFPKSQLMQTMGHDRLATQDASILQICFDATCLILTHWKMVLLKGMTYHFMPLQSPQAEDLHFAAQPNFQAEM